MNESVELSAIASPLPYTLPAPVGRQFLFAEELVERWGGRVSASTLEKWRGAGEGPPFAKLGRLPIYPLLQLVNWELALYQEPPAG